MQSQTAVPPDHKAGSNKLPPADRRIRKVLVPVFLEIPVDSDDPEQAEFLAVKQARDLSIPCRDGTIRVTSLLAPLCDDSSRSSGENDAAVS